MRLIISIFVGVILFAGCKKDEPNTTPLASFLVNYLSGTPDTLFIFDASSSSERESPDDKLFVRWDLDQDDQWDTEWLSEKTLNHKFPRDTIYTVTLEVKDEGGLTDSSKTTITINSKKGVFIDHRDGREYRWIRIGDMTWMEENLAFLPEVSPPTEGSYTDPYYYVFG